MLYEKSNGDPSPRMQSRSFLVLFSYSWRPYAGVITGAEFPEPVLALRWKCDENFTDEAQVQ